MAGNFYLPAKPDLITQHSRTDGLVYSWLCPSGVTQLRVELQGAGGRGGDRPGESGGGGGGGGAFWNGDMTVTPGNTYHFASGPINGGDAYARDNTGAYYVVTANGGANGTTTDPSSGGAGGTVSIDTPADVLVTIDTFSGGAGGHGLWGDTTPAVNGADVVVSATLTRAGGARGDAITGPTSGGGGGGAGASYTANGGAGGDNSSYPSYGAGGGGGAGASTPSQASQTTGANGPVGRFLIEYEISEGVTDSDLVLVP